MKTTLLAFDAFGTVFDLSGVDREEVRSYARHIRQPEWSPLKLPASWESLPAHPDAAEGIRLLRQKFLVVTCSNGPLGLLARLSKHNGIPWDAIVPLEMFRAFKPDPRTYLGVCGAMGVEPAEACVVTANRTFGDLEAARSLGMRAVLIRDPAEGGPRDIIELARTLEDTK